MTKAIRTLLYGKLTGVVISALTVALTLSAAGMRVVYAVSADPGPAPTDLPPKN